MHLGRKKGAHVLLQSWMCALSAGCSSAAATCGTMLSLTSLCVVTACSADLENGQRWNLGLPRGERFVPSFLPVSYDREANLSSAVFWVLPVMDHWSMTENFPFLFLSWCFLSIQ